MSDRPQNIIFPLAGTKNPKDSFVVADIENFENGDLICIGMSFRDDRERIVHHLFDDWKQFTDYIILMAQEDKKFTRIWAHNGGGWDWANYFQWLLEHKAEFSALEMFPVIVGTKYVVLQLDFNCVYEKDLDTDTVERKCTSIKLCDSLYLMRSSLEELSVKFLGKGKLKIDMMAWDLFTTDKKRFYEYLKTDCENLLLILERFYLLVRENICLLDRLGNTIGATSLRLFRTFSKQCIRIPSDKDGDKEMRQKLRDAYSGGRVEVFNYGYHEKVNVYDINSLYPFVMRDHYYPVDNKTVPIFEYRKGVPAIYTVNFRQPNRRIPSVLCIKGKPCYEGSGTFFGPEIGLLKRMGGEVEILEGIAFCNSQKIFKEFIDKMWALRKSDYKGPLGLVCKFLMNALYGKFCERPKYTKLMLLNGSIWENIQRICNYQAIENEKRKEADRNLIRVDILDEKNGAYLISDQDAICVNEHVGIGGLITSWSRVELYERFLLTGAENLVYCDTDSIHTFGTLPIGSELGDTKIEHSGEGVYCGKKLYALRGVKDGKPYEKVTAKGVSFCSRENFKDQKFVLEFEDMRRLLRGESIVAKFSQPATAKEILKGKKSCQILRKNQQGQIQHNRKRTLRKT